MTNRIQNTIETLLPLRMAIITCVVAACFITGLFSGFIFDDFPNLDALEYIKTEAVMSPGFREFVLGGKAGPLGRPLSLFTFALQADAWPDNPMAFKIVNLAIHCMNSLLVYWLCSILAGVLKIGKRQAIWFSLFTSLLWGINPLHTSTVLYAVQRMALLSNFFILAGVTSYLYIRASDREMHGRNLAVLSLTLAVPGVLSLLSKENAPSLIFYVLVLEYTLLRSLPVTSLFRKWRYGFLWLPAIITVLLPLIFWGRIQESYQTYALTPVDRLLTESRILWQYLAVIFAPSNSGASLFHDITASTDILTPPATLLSLIAWITLIVATSLKPGKHRIFQFALLWYFSGHIIESTILSLELYFNHRNYLAFLGPLIALVYCFFTMVPQSSLALTRKQAICALYGLLLGFQTIAISNLWKEPLLLAESWYIADPQTARNAEFYAIELAETGVEGLAQSAAIYEAALARDSDDFRLLLNRMTISCASPRIPPPDESLIRQHLQQANRNRSDLITPLQQLVTLTTNNQCSIYSPELLTEIINSLKAGSDEEATGHYDFELAKLHIFQQENEAAIQLMVSAYDRLSDPGILFNLSFLLINEGRYGEALVYIDEAITRVGRSNDIRTGTRAEKLARLEEMRNDVTGFIDANSE